MARPRRTEFHPRLGEFRQRAGLTQEEVAERVGINAEMVRRHERGINFPIKLYRERYCQVYQATEEELGLRSDLRVLRERRGWPQTEVVERLRRVADCQLPDDLLNQYKRWERSRYSPSEFYVELLNEVFGNDTGPVSHEVGGWFSSGDMRSSESVSEFVSALLDALSNGTRLVIGVEPASAVTSVPALTLVPEQSVSHSPGGAQGRGW